MSDEPKTADDGILDKARRMADRVGEYARSDGAKEKLDSVRKRAIEVGGMATTGAKRLLEGTKKAVEAKNKADEFSRSEQIQGVRAQAKKGWDEIRHGGFRGSLLSEAPLVVGLAIFLFFPVGLYLLWRHHVLGRNRTWWWAGGTWGLLVTLVVLMRGGDGSASPRAQALMQGAPAGSPVLGGEAGGKGAALDGPPGEITPQAVLAAVETFNVSGIDYSKGPRGETLVTREGFDEDAKKPATESGFLGPDGRFVLHGPTTTWFEAPTSQSSGRRLYETFYFDGERHGIHREWRETGEKKIERTYKRGKNHGVGIWYYKDGSIGAVDELKDGYKNGLSCKWHENGRVESVGRSRTDVVDGEVKVRSVGRSRSWFDDGSPNTEVTFNDSGNVHGRCIEHLPKGRPVETLWEDGHIVFDRGTCNKRTLHQYMKARMSTHDGEGAEFIVKSAQEFFQRVGHPEPGSVVYNNHDSDDQPWGFRCTYRCSDGDLSVLVRSISNNVMVFIDPEDTLR